MTDSTHSTSRVPFPSDHHAYEYRVCAGDVGDLRPDATEWVGDVEAGLSTYESALASNKLLDPGYDAIWLEVRLVSAPQRVEDGRLASMLETYRSDQLK